jgi:hypothetical protein
MPARKVDIVFCLDISDSMAPCIAAVKDNITTLVKQLRQANYDWRLDFIAHNVPGEHVYSAKSVRKYSVISSLYRKPNPSDFFTDSLDEFCAALSKLEVDGDENMLYALDCALDMPFGPAAETQRVVIMLSDEPFISNYRFHEDKRREKVSALITKIQARCVTLFAIMPHDEIVEDLATVDKADFIPVETKDNGLAEIDLGKLFAQFGKTISVQTRQQGEEGKYEEGLFGQKTMGDADSSWDSITDKK